MLVRPVVCCIVLIGMGYAERTLHGVISMTHDLVIIIGILFTSRNRIIGFRPWIFVTPAMQRM